MSKAVVFLAAGSEECEALLVVDILRRAGVEVTIAAAGSDKTVVTSHKVTVVTDALAADIDPADYDACILPGGIPGVNNLAADPDVRRVCDACNAAGKRVAAICAAPTVLAGFGRRPGRSHPHRGRSHRGRQHHHRPRSGRRHPLRPQAGGTAGRQGGLRPGAPCHRLPLLMP